MTKLIDQQDLNDLAALIFKLQSINSVCVMKSAIEYNPNDSPKDMLTIIHLPAPLFEAYLNKVTNSNDFIHQVPQGRA